MNTIRFEWKAFVLSVILLPATTALAQTPTLPVEKPAVIGTIKDPSVSATPPKTNVVVTADSLPDAKLDLAVAALEKGNKAESAQALQSGISELEAQTKKQPSSFGTKILSQVSNLKALLPLIMGGGLGAGVLGKAVGLTKLASGAGRLENLVSAGSLIGKASQLTSGLNGLGSAMSVLGGGSSAGQSLISSALGSVGKLDQGGMVAKAAEPAVKNQIGSVLNFVKGAL